MNTHETDNEENHDHGWLLPLTEVQDPPLPKHGDMFGRWRFNHHNLTLEIRVDGEKAPPYWVDLEESGGGEQEWERIIHISKKLWCSPEDVGNLIKGLIETSQCLPERASSGAY